MSAQPNLQAETTFSLSAVVRDELQSDEADPHVIAATIVGNLDLADCRTALATVLPDYVAKVIARTRKSGATLATSARWENVAALHATGELALLRNRVFTGMGWKFLGDCDRSDVESLAKIRENEAAMNAASAERFRKLRTAMGRKRAVIVSDLPVDVLQKIFDA